MLSSVHFKILFRTLGFTPLLILAACTTPSTHSASQAAPSERTPASISAGRIESALATLDQPNGIRVFVSTINSHEAFDGAKLETVPDHSSDVTYQDHTDIRTPAGKKRLAEILSSRQNTCLATQLVSMAQLLDANKDHYLKVAHGKFLRDQQEMAALKRFADQQKKAGLPYYGKPIRVIKENEFTKLLTLIHTESDEQRAQLINGEISKIDYFREPLSEIQTSSTDRTVTAYIVRNSWGSQKADTRIDNWYEWDQFVKNTLKGKSPDLRACEMSAAALEFLIGS